MVHGCHFHGGSFCISFAHFLMANKRTYLGIGDLLDVRNRLWQLRSLGFLRKLFKPSLQRTADTFDHQFEHAIWNTAPAVRARLNFLASGDPGIPYEAHVVAHYLRGKDGASLLSIGCGVASHELAFAALHPFDLVHGIDLAPQLIDAANREASQRGLPHAHFEVKNFMEGHFDRKYDVVLFHQSLHHFADFDHILGQWLPTVLKEDGVLVINEFVGPTRLQWTQAQLMVSNEALQRIPKPYRRIFRTPFYKNKVYRPGWWRMLASDPSESVNSEAIRTKLHTYCTPLEEKELGGNLLHIVLKDIAHHFCGDSDEVNGLISELFAAEDAFLMRHPSDFIFGVYRLNYSKTEQ